MLLLALAAVCVGLLLASQHLLREHAEHRSNLWWAASAFLFALSLSSGAWLILNVSHAAVSQFRLVTVANTLGFAAFLTQAVFYRTQNNTQLKHVSALGWLFLIVLVYALFFEWVRVSGNLNERMMIAALSSALAHVWQVIELRRLRFARPVYQIRFMYWLAIALLISATSRALLSIMTEVHIIGLAQIPASQMMVMILQMVLSVLSYFAISKYCSEQMSFERGKMQMESDQVTALLAAQERLILKLSAANKTAATGALSASLVHEIAQPLTALQINLQVLSRQNEDVTMTESRRQILTQCTENMLRLKEVLQTVRGIFINDKESESVIFIDDILRKVQSLICKEASDAHIRIQFDVTERLCMLGRSSELQHVILNLIINAIQAIQPLAQADKAIEIKASSADGHILVTVSDNGIGVDKSMTDRLFDLLDSGKPGGMGLGLWLSKHVVERHRGKISHRFNHPQGAVFEMIFPLAHAESESVS